MPANKSRKSFGDAGCLTSACCGSSSESSEEQYEEDRARLGRCGGCCGPELCAVGPGGGALKEGPLEVVKCAQLAGLEAGSIKILSVPQPACHP